MPDFPKELLRKLDSENSDFREMMSAIRENFKKNLRDLGYCTFNDRAGRGGDMKLEFSSYFWGSTKEDALKVKDAICNVKKIMNLEGVSEIDGAIYPGFKTTTQLDPFDEDKTYPLWIVSIDVESLKCFVRAYKRNPELFLKAFGDGIAQREKPSVVVSSSTSNPIVETSTGIGL